MQSGVFTAVADKVGHSQTNHAMSAVFESNNTMRNDNGMDNMVSAEVQLLLHKTFQTEALCPVSVVFLLQNEKHEGLVLGTKLQTAKHSQVHCPFDQFCHKLFFIFWQLSAYALPTAFSV